MTTEIKDDIRFLLQFVPEIDPDKVVSGLPNMYYLTGKYEGDVEIAVKANEIMERHDIDPSSLSWNKENEEDVY